MREILKIISIPVNGKPMDLRLTKLDAFSGVTLLRLMAKMPEGGTVTDLLRTTWYNQLNKTNLHFWRFAVGRKPGFTTSVSL